MTTTPALPPMEYRTEFIPYGHPSTYKPPHPKRLNSAKRRELMFSLEKAMIRFNEAQEAPLSNLKHFFSKNLSLCNLQKSYQYNGFDDTKTGISVVDPFN